MSNKASFSRADSMYKKFLRYTAGYNYLLVIIASCVLQELFVHWIAPTEWNYSTPSLTSAQRERWINTCSGVKQLSMRTSAWVSFMIHSPLLFIARKHTDAGYWYSNSVRPYGPSDCPSILPLRSCILRKRLTYCHSNFLHHTVAQLF